MRKLLSLWLPVLAFVAMIYGISAQSTVPGAELFWDKALHVFAYALFGLVCLRAFHGGMHPLRFWPMIGALALTLLHGLFDEWHQSMVPGRFASLADWVADAIGAAVSVLVFSLWVRRPRVIDAVLNP